MPQLPRLALHRAHVPAAHLRPGGAAPMSTCPTPTKSPRSKRRRTTKAKRAQPKQVQPVSAPAESEPVPAGMVRLRSGQIVTEEDASELLPRARPPGERAPAREVPADAEPTYHRTPASACCAHTFDPEALHDELDDLRAEVAREREARIRAESFAEGERAAYERVLASVLAAPVQPHRPAAATAALRVTRGSSVTAQRD
ncbi:hypothetical protein D7V97_03395, partial [Corallococcus sp. CA053C]